MWFRFAQLQQNLLTTNFKMCFSVFISILISTILVIIHFLFLFLICLNLLYLLYSIYISMKTSLKVCFHAFYDVKPINFLPCCPHLCPPSTLTPLLPNPCPLTIPIIMSILFLLSMTTQIFSRQKSRFLVIFCTHELVGYINGL